MRLENKINTFTLTNGGLNFNILQSGDIRSITDNMTQINLLQANNLEGSSSNIYLRVYENNKIYYTKLIGIDSPSQFFIENNQAIYRGTFKAINYEVILSVVENSWFWDVRLTDVSNNNRYVDVLYGQDVAIADQNAVKNNEAYVCQYIDHKIFKNEMGYTVCTRQNQGIPHYLQQGSLTKNIAYSTDGFQFFGLDYKLTNVPQAMYKESLENKNYQYEFAYTALQSEKVCLDEPKQFVFYGYYEENIVEVATDIRFLDKITQRYQKIKAETKPVEDKGTKVETNLSFSHVLESLPLTEEELNQIYPDKRHIETEDGTLLSFFNESSSHVILKDKERYVERPHGNILLTGNNLFIKEEIISSTNYIFGVFNSHIVVGNSNFNKFTSDLRNPLNIAKTSGQRIFIEMNGHYQLLGIPSVYEVGINYSKWIYKLNDDLLTITSMALVDSPQLILDIQSKNNKPYNFIITNQVTLSPSEYEQPFDYEVKGNKIEFIPATTSMSHHQYPELKYNMIVSCPFNVSNDAIFYEDKKVRNEPLVSLSIKETTSFQIITQGLIHGEEYEVKQYDLLKVKQDYEDYFRNNINHFHLTIDNEYKEEVEKFNDIAMWYTHNALIHYASPHGLEQYNGAAWGTRDVCQGPIEYFLATQKYDVVRDVLLKIYSHQFKQNGDWPQWFMFDKFYNIQARESHGDIIVWPIRTLANYLMITGDYSILDEKVCYTDLDRAEYTKETTTILEHVKHAINAIEDSFIKGTHLSCYGGGDWDDTLQPANHSLTKSMVSGWTVALTYEAFKVLAAALNDFNQDEAKTINQMAEAIKTDYMKYVIKDDVPAGFLVFNEDKINYILHESDKETGMKYRLLPFNRGIISEMFTKKQTEKYYELINKHLKHPDGVRLMDHAVKYQGGINTYFTRAETASNFGREIGLQYVHAHIRYIEAMAKLGRVDDVWNGLLTINPIKIQDQVPNALHRQSNTYFSSSDAKFYDRYEAMNHFDKLRTGQVGVKGGWRIYSSGPGIYLNQFITNTLGIKVLKHDLVLDPVLPKKLDGLKLNYQFNEKPLEIHYHLSGTTDKKKVLINGKEIKLELLDNKYRQGGVLIKEDQLNYAKNVIDIYM